MLLAFLVLHRKRHTREKLAALLWGDTSGVLARTSLRTALANLRRLIGDNLVLADREMAQFNPDFPQGVDPLEFGTQSKALLAVEATPTLDLVAIELYQGDLLADFCEDWILVEREVYRGLYLEAFHGPTCRPGNRIWR